MLQPDSVPRCCVKQSGAPSLISHDVPPPGPALAGAAASTAYISTSGGAGAAPTKAAFELTEVVEATGTPRSARRRNATPFNTAG